MKFSEVILSIFAAASLLRTGSCVPEVCQTACLRGFDGEYLIECDDNIDPYCRSCRFFGYCPDAWFNSIAWNPYAPKTCPEFDHEIETNCTNKDNVGSTCQLSCEEGHVPAPELYGNYYGSMHNYTHEELMKFSVKCEYDTDGFSVDWTPNYFSCVSKEEILEEIISSNMIIGPSLPYPEDVILELFEEELSEIEPDDSDDFDELDGRRFWNPCSFACKKKGKKYLNKCDKFKGRVQRCIMCQYRYCGYGAIVKG